MSKFDRDYSDAKKIRERKYAFASWRSNKQRFQYCSDTDGKRLYMRAVEGHSGGNKVGLSLQDNVHILYGWVKIYWCLGRLKFHYNSRYTTVFFTAVDSADRTLRRAHIF